MTFSLFNFIELLIEVTNASNRITGVIKAASKCGGGTLYHKPIFTLMKTMYIS